MADLYTSTPADLAGIQAALGFGKTRLQARVQPPIRALTRRLATGMTFTDEGTTAPSGYQKYASIVGAALNPLFHYRRGNTPIAAGPSFPLNQMVKLSGVSYSATKNSNSLGVAIQTDGADVYFGLKGASTLEVVAKVDGEYVSLTPLNVPGNDGAVHYFKVTLPGGKLVDVEIVCNSSGAFAGVWAPVASAVVASPPKGPKVVWFGDSGIEPGGVTGIPTCFADAMGWDNVQGAGVGTTGVLNPGSYTKYRDRVATDLPTDADLVILSNTVNDSAQVATALVAEWRLLIAAVQARAPRAEIWMTSPWANKGGGHFTAQNYINNDAVRALAAELGLFYIDWLDQPIPDGITPASGTLASAASSGATSLSLTGEPAIGSMIKFADGSRSFVTNVAGSGPAFVSVDKVTNAQASGAAWTQCGSSLWRGSGYVGNVIGNGNCDTWVKTDGTHPTPIGASGIAAAAVQQAVAYYARR